MGSHSLLQGIFSTKGSNPGLSHCRQILYHLRHQGSHPGDRNGYPLQYSGLEISVDCIVHGVAKSRTRLSDFHSLTHFWLGKLDERWFSLLRWKKLGKEVAELFGTLITYLQPIQIHHVCHIITNEHGFFVLSQFFLEIAKLFSPSGAYLI